MSDIIQLLPDSLANQIAAGEVVQRPASAVKELLENSIDAGSTNIKLIVKEAGKQLIQIIDNGSGMSETDARMSFERHATSKIKKTDDLFTIRTHGFRGEALASIAAIAQVELKTRRENDELGTCIKIEGSDIKAQEAVTCEKGAAISVKNLFFNVPARRNFLKSNPVELRHIIDEFQRIALAYPQIAMSFIQNDLEIFNLPSEKLSHRIVSIFGKLYKEQLIPCEEETEMIRIHGYIGKPENSKKNRGEQFFFVNNRYIKHNYLHHAVMNAFEELIGDDSFPFYVLFIDIDPKHIDINVHPTKTEIKFDDERTLYHIIRATVKKSLATHNIAPSLDFGLDVNFSAFSSNEINLRHEGSDGDNGSKYAIGSFQKPAADNWQLLYDGFERDASEEIPAQHHDNLRVLPPEEEAIKLEKGLLYSENNSTFQLHHKYIVSQVKSGMVIIDQQAAHERILYEKYFTQLQNRFGASQQFLFPQTIELSPGDFNLIMEMENDIRALGFVFNIFGKNTIVVNGIPSDVPNGSEKDLFEGLIEQYKYFKTELHLDKKENLARSLARKSSLRPGTKLSLVEMNTLIDQLFACKVPNFAPNGNLTIVLMDMNRIGKFFSR